MFVALLRLVIKTTTTTKTKAAENREWYCNNGSTIKTEYFARVVPEFGLKYSVIKVFQVTQIDNQ